MQNQPGHFVQQPANDDWKTMNNPETIQYRQKILQ